MKSGAGANVGVEEWRRRAVDVFMLALFLLYSPVILLWLAGQGPPRTTVMLALGLPSYLAVALAALLRGVPHHIRVWLVLACSYPALIILPFIVPLGPLVRITPVTFPNVALALVGFRSGRVATCLSLVAIWTHPVVCLLTGGEAATLWAVRPEPDIPQALLITRAVALTAVLLAQIILLERFFGFLAVALSRVRGESEMRKEALNELAFQIDERTRLEREVTRIGDEERRRLGQDVHDGVCQQLTAARLRCQVLQRKLEKKENLRPEELGALGGVLEDAIDEAHAVAKGLCPLQDTPSALADALRALVRRTQESTPMHCCFTLTGDVEVAEPSVAEQLYRIAQEALANAVRHSEANHVEVELASDHDELHLRIEDNGKGLPPDVRTHDGLGLRTMPHRAQTINATLTITPGAAGGTRITCRVPQSGAMEAWNE